MSDWMKYSGIKECNLMWQISETIRKCISIYERNESNQEKIEEKVQRLNDMQEDVFDSLSQMLKDTMIKIYMNKRLDGIVEETISIAERLKELHDAIGEALEAEKPYLDIESAEAEVEALIEKVLEAEVQEADLMGHLDAFDYDDFVDSYDDFLATYSNVWGNNDDDDDDNIIEFKECEDFSNIDELLSSDDWDDDLLEYLSEEDEEE